MIVIILVNWNGHQDTVECLESLTRLDTPANKFRVIVSDNDSKPGSVEHIVAWCKGSVEVPRSTAAWNGLPAERRHEVTHRLLRPGEMLDFSSAPLVTILMNGANLGFAGGNNRAIELALSDPSTEAVWLLNNDTICRTDALDALAARLAHNSHTGIVGSTLVYYDDPTKVQGLGGTFDGRKGRGDHIGKFLDLQSLPSREDVELQMTYVIGASMLVSRRFLREIGLMEEGYFLYFEEADWSERNAGRFAIGWEPTSIVYHKEGASIGTSLVRRASDTSIYYFNRNLLIFTWRYYRPWIIMISLRVAARAVRFLAQGDVMGSRMVWRAFRDAILGWGKFLRH